MDDQLAHLLRLGTRRIDRVDLTHTREIVGQLRPGLRLQILLGARGVGKTTALRQYARLHLAGERSAYLDLDDLYFAERRLLETVDQLYERGYRVLLLDEVHRYAGWSREIKTAYDRYEDLRIALTGSSMSALVQGDGDLSRRARWYELTGMSLREYARLVRGIDLPRVALQDLPMRAEELAGTVSEALRPHATAPVPLLADYLVSGYYPFVLEDPEGYLDRLRRACHTAIDIDIAPVGALTPESTHKLKRLLELLAGNVPYRPNVSHVERQLGADRKQVYRLLDLLERAALIRRLWAPGKSPTTLRKPEKIYLDNPNLAHALASVDVGNLRETAFLAMVTPVAEVSAGRTADFVIEGTDYEVGGRGKSRRQLPDGGVRVVADVAAPFADDVVPLWIFGLLY